MTVAMLNGKQVFVLPWMAQAARPWTEGYERVGIPCQPTRTGKRMIEQVVRRDKLSDIHAE